MVRKQHIFVTNRIICFMDYMRFNMLLPVVCDLSVMAAVVTVSDSDVSVVNVDRIGESAAVIPVSDSDESVVDEVGIGKNLSKEDWKRLLENDWLTDKVSVYLEL